MTIKAKDPSDNRELLIDAEEGDVQWAIRLWDVEKCSIRERNELAGKYGIDPSIGRPYVWDTIKAIAEERYRVRMNLEWSQEKTKEIEFIGSAIESWPECSASTPGVAEGTSGPSDG